MNLRTVYSVTASVVGLLFVVRYVVNERRLAALRTQAIIQSTRDRVKPWSEWEAWRQSRINEEFSA